MVISERSILLQSIFFGVDVEPCFFADLTFVTWVRFRGGYGIVMDMHGRKAGSADEGRRQTVLVTDG
jgi:hypothetical protein